MNTLEKIKELKVKDVMDDVFVISSPEQTIREIAKDIIEMKASESIIINKEGNALGIVTLRDIVSAISKGISPKEKITQIMTPKLITAYEDDPLEDALIKLGKYSISRLPVLNQNNEIVGILGEKKLLKVIPTLYEILEEAQTEDSLQESPQTKEGICENCGEYSEELIQIDGKWLCKECYEELYA